MEILDQMYAALEAAVDNEGDDASAAWLVSDEFLRTLKRDVDPYNFPHSAFGDPLSQPRHLFDLPFVISPATAGGPPWQLLSVRALRLLS